MKKANIAVIGCGKLAQNQHISNLMIAKNANLACFCDVSKETLDELHVRFPEVPIETDYKKVLANPEIDGVVIATREEYHVPISIEAMEAGKHVYVEKPLAETPEECEKVLIAEQKTGKKALVGMNRRMAPAYRDAKKILDRNGGMKSAFYRIADAFEIDWGEYYGLGKRLTLECCHIIDILRYFAGSEVASVFCAASRQDEESILLTFKNGATAMILSSGYAPWETPKEHFEAMAEIGLVTVDEFCELHTYGMPGEESCRYYEGHSHVEREQSHKKWIKNDGLKGCVALRAYLADEQRRIEALDHNSKEYEKERHILDYRYPHINYSVDKGWLGAMEHFADVILNDVPVEAARASDGLNVTQIINAIVESRDTGKIIKLDL
ncbi:MAG: Gfo/Idh/MocA family oxidoreductase [Clostridia bacterium]|nr:Gfo/Idh/MocA family oxidoreductase [Clostridia bacterium]